MKNKTRTKSESTKIHQKYHRSTQRTTKIIAKNNFTYRHIIEVINKYIKPGKSKVLDIGSGAGSLAFYISNRGAQVTGLDISQKAVDECIKSAEELGLRQARFVQAYFPGDFKSKKLFDFAIFTEVIEHLEDDDMAVKKIAHSLKNKGVLILSTPSVFAPLHRLGLTRKFDQEVGHLRRYDLKNLKNLLIKNGFRIIEIKKTEGILRNILFVNPYAGKLVRILNHFGSDIATFLDNISLKLFGESNYIIVAEKIGKKK